MQLERLTNLQLKFPTLDVARAGLTQAELRVIVEGSMRLLARQQQEPPIGMTRSFFVTNETEFSNIEELRKSNCTLLNHLCNFRGRQCGDPRDRVYALRSLACDIKQSDIDPDYNEDVSQTFARATKAILKRQQNLNVMFLCCNPEDPEVVQGQRPSWVPRFNNPADWPTKSLTQWIPGNEPYYKATNQTKANPQFPGRSSELALEGYEVGVIKDSVPLQELSSYQSAWRDALLKSWTLAERDVAVVHNAHDGLRHAFSRTLITSRTSRSEVARPDYEDAQFELFWNFVSYPEDQQEENLRMFEQYNAAFFQHGFARSFFTTQHGRMGLAPLAAKIGDKVCLLAGGQVPFVLREAGQNYYVVGEGYVHGVMDGHCWKDLESRKKSRDRFVLI